MTLTAPRTSFASLSVKDLLDAREAYHTHLLHFENVVATAIGRYRFVKTDPPANEERGRDDPRTLANSEVRPNSWPCVMVFVDRWIPRADFGKKVDDIVPPRLYLPDGRVVPTCVILAKKQDEAAEQATTLRFPHSVLGGGYPSLSQVQGETRFATIGCLVTDGDNTFALTNLHVGGNTGRELFTLVQGQRERLGVTFQRQVGKIPFEKAYPGFQGPRSVLNLDAALVRVDDLSRWTSQVYGIGQFDDLADLNVDTANVDLIGCQLKAFGAASGEMRGEIQGLFYRYRSVGGQDQLADVLIGPPSGLSEEEYALEARKLGRHGNSGSVWFLIQENPDKNTKPHIRPFALHWGGQSFVSGDSKQSTQYALAASLGLICRELELEIVRDVNVGLPERWGKVGHYKVGQLACELATDQALATLLEKNVSRISFRSEIDKDLVNVDKDADFIPLADVSDLVWKRGGQSVRGKEGPNHFADMDQPSPDFSGANLLTLCEDEAFIDPEKWNSFYESLDIDAPHRGLLPFRVWQLFDEMVGALKDTDLTRYVGAAGVLAHYLGDACQPLHVSMFHDGDPESGRGKGVHSAYETTMLDRFAPDLNAEIEQLQHPALPNVKSGSDAAREVVKLMKRSIKAIPPTELIDVYEDKGHRVAELWDAFGKKTAKRILDGASTLAAIWQGAWVQGGGTAKFGNDLRTVSKSRLAALYLKKTWAPSVHIDDMKLQQGKLVITP